MDYEEFKNRLGNLGLSIKDFTALVGLHQNNATHWKNNGFPEWVIKVIEGLECKRELESIKSRIKNLCDDKE